jgi:hypothetical protein
VTTIYTLFLDPTEKPSKSPPSTVVDIILIRASITITKSRGDNESLYLKPLVLLKKLEGTPFIKTEKRTVEIQNAIHARFFSPKPLLFNKCNTNFQFT